MTTKKKTAAPRANIRQTSPATALENQNAKIENPDTVLLAVTGMSPAILTETIWALAHEPEPTIPRRVIVVTTTSGRDEIRRQLFQPLPRFNGQSAWDTLRASLASEGFDLRDRLHFGDTGDDIRVITAFDPAQQRNIELPDIRTPAENEAAARFLLEQVRGVVENPDVRLVASLAGGRKTMGALLYACLTLAGRETDRLTHVLVSEPFETLREFFFPGQPGGPITKSEIRNPKLEISGPQSEIKNQKSEISLAPSHARVQLADTPFVPLRNLFVRELGRKVGDFMQLVASCRENVRQLAAERLRLTVDQSRPQIELNGQFVKFAPREHAVMLFLAIRAKRGEPPFGKHIEAIESLNQCLAELRAAAPKDNWADWRMGLKQPFSATDDQELRKALSSLRAKIKRLGPDGAALAAALPEHGRFSLDLPGSLIHLR